MLSIKLLNMNNLFLKKLLMLKSKLHRPFEIIVEGTSMQPILYHGQIITVCWHDRYSVGDILVFFYKNDALLVHRLLKIQNGRYFCKGDNSFRLEDIGSENIVGAVILEFDANNTSEFIADSYLISRIFQRNGYDIAKTKASLEYMAYEKKHLRNET